MKQEAVLNRMHEEDIASHLLRSDYLLLQSKEHISLLDQSILDG